MTISEKSHPHDTLGVRNTSVPENLQGFAVEIKDVFVDILQYSMQVPIVLEQRFVLLELRQTFAKALIRVQNFL